MIIPHQTHLSPERSNENENPVLHHQQRDAKLKREKESKEQLTKVVV